MHEAMSDIKTRDPKTQPFKHLANQISAERNYTFKKSDLTELRISTANLLHSKLDLASPLSFPRPQ